jgi:hypothetical protein
VPLSLDVLRRLPGAQASIGHALLLGRHDAPTMASS